MIVRKIADFCKRICGDRRGNVLMIFGFSLLPLTFATGMTVDYTRAARLQTRMNAITDAAALAGVTPAMLQKTPLESAVAVANMWYAQSGITQGQSGTFNNVIYNAYAPAITNNSSTRFTGADGTITIDVTDTNTTGLSRTIAVTYKVASVNMFGGLLGRANIAIGGASTTNAKTAPNIDFYVLLDTSGSMAFPSTSAGITLLGAKTGGCAFACHSTNDAKARDASNNLTDYYQVARSYNIPLRVDEAKTAITSMMDQAVTTGTNNNATYRAALYSFAAADVRANNEFTSLRALTSNLPSVGTAASSAATSLYYSNGCPTSTYCNNDTDTATSDAFTRLNTIMPNPGNGTKVSPDTPQAILFVITDGMRDETRASGRPEVAIDTALCTTIKSRGIRIAILYTEYLQSSMDNDSWSQSNVVPYLSTVEPALTNCASAGLMYKVTTDDDITAALNKLFNAAVSTAHITQ